MDKNENNISTENSFGVLDNGKENASKKISEVSGQIRETENLGSSNNMHFPGDSSEAMRHVPSNNPIYVSRPLQIPPERPSQSGFLGPIWVLQDQISEHSSLDDHYLSCWVQHPR